MKVEYINDMGSERTIETRFVEEMLLKYASIETSLLDVGGIPSTPTDLVRVKECIKNIGLNYKISDFRGGDYPGDFCTFDFGELLFDIILFLSSLEHFPQCTEGDMVKREREDKKGFKKALQILKPKGKVILTVPFGKPVWQNYHQNYDMDLILDLTEGSSIIESYTYRLHEDTWVLSDPSSMTDILYTDRAYGVGCFVLEKN